MLEVKNLTFTYPGAGAEALGGLSFTCAPGELVLLCGASGSGKTTLLRLLKREIAPHGTKTGEVLWGGRPLGDLTPAESARDIGFVFQDPENQLVAATVRQELAFGLENLGVPGEEIRRRVAETALFFGVDRWAHKTVDALSGGEKQVLGLASVMAMNPRLLLLDEPTAQLDPVAAKEFLGLLGRLCGELGTTVLLSEHRLEELLPMAHKVALLEKGRLEFFGPPQGFTEYVLGVPGHPFTPALAVATRIAARVTTGEKNSAPPPAGKRWPISVGEGQAWARQWLDGRRPGPPKEQEKSPPGPVAAEAKDLWFRYGRGEEFVLRGLSLSLEAGTIHGVLGGNGAGKTTLLRLLAGVGVPYQGRVRCRDGRRAGMLSQFPKAMFTRDTLAEELVEGLVPSAQMQEEKEALAARFGLAEVLGRHPFDLSGGEQQRAALAKLLLRHLDILLLDEPTKGLDAFAKADLGLLLLEQKAEGKTILLVTHDVEFAAAYCDACSLLYGGGIVCTQGVEDFFRENNFFTTAACRITRGLGGPPAVTCEDAADSLLCSVREDAPGALHTATPPRPS